MQSPHGRACVPHVGKQRGTDNPRTALAAECLAWLPDDYVPMGGRPSRRPAHAGRGRGRGRWEGARFPVRSGSGNGERPLQADLRPGPTGGTLRRAQRPGQVAWEAREGTADCAGPEGPGMAARPSARGQSLGRLRKRVDPPPGKAPTPERSVLPEPSPTALQGER